MNYYRVVYYKFIVFRQFYCWFLPINEVENTKSNLWFCSHENMSLQRFFNVNIFFYYFRMIEGIIIISRHVRIFFWIKNIYAVIYFWRSKKVSIPNVREHMHVEKLVSIAIGISCQNKNWTFNLIMENKWDRK